MVTWLDRMLRRRMGAHRSDGDLMRRRIALKRGVGMAAKQRDRIVIDSDKAGQPAREGEILEVIEASYGTRYRVSWDDGHETTIRPAGGSFRVVHPKSQAGSKG